MPVAVSVSPLRTTRSELAGFSFMLRDVTERKLAEEQLRRLLAEGDRNARWQAVMADVRLHLLGDEPLLSVLAVICDYLCELLDAKGAIAAVGRPPRVVAVGGNAETFAGDLGSLAGFGDDGGVRLIDPIALEPALQQVFDDAIVLLVPIRNESETTGHLLCGLAEPPDEMATTIAASLAAQAGLGIKLDRARVDRERLLIGDERERIARDLHDLVIQRLFASGLSLQSVLPLVHDDRAVGRLGKVVDELDETIREIRTTIFTLAPPPLASTGLRVELLGVAGDASRVLGFEPSLRFEGPVDNAVGTEVLPHVLAVVREALSNVARHAHADRATIEVRTDEDEITVVVTDDGVGIGEVTRESGLRNLRARAAELGGALELAPQEGGGTRLEWRVPLDRIS